MNKFYCGLGVDVILLCICQSQGELATNPHIDFTITDLLLVVKAPHPDIEASFFFVTGGNLQ